MNNAPKRQSLLQRIATKLPEDLQRALQPVAASLQGSAEREELTSKTAPGYDDVIETAWKRASRQSARIERKITETGPLWSSLLSLAPERRRLHFLNQPKLHSVATVTRLLRSSWDQRTVEPEDSEHLASLALDVLERITSVPKAPGLLHDLRARAWIQIGNARRIQSDFHGAEEALHRAQQHVEQGSQDPMELAMLNHAWGRLFQDQRRFDEASPLLKRACRQYRQIRDTNGQAHALITLGANYRDAGEPERGLAMMRRAEEVLPSHHELLLHIRHNQIYFLIDLGRYEEAEALLTETRPLYAHASEPLVRLRLPWIEGRIAKHTDRPEEAEYLFQKVRQGFIEHGIAYDAALVSLELAEIYVQQGRNEELKELAHEMVTVFRSRNVEREALAALLMLHHAASAERATLHVIRDIADRLRQRAPQALTPLSPGDA